MKLERKVRAERDSLDICTSLLLCTSLPIFLISNLLFLPSMYFKLRLVLYI